MSITHSLLALLNESPTTASGLRNAFDEATDHVWPMNIGQVAQTLSRLERDGLITEAGEVTGANGRAATAYSITDAGREVLEQWWHSPTEKTRADRDELVVKISLAAATHAPDVIDMLDIQRRANMAELRELNRRLVDTLSAETLSIERRLFDLEAESRWLDRVEALTRIKEQR